MMLKARERKESKERRDESKELAKRDDMEEQSKGAYDVACSIYSHIVRLLIFIFYFFSFVNLARRGSIGLSAKFSFFETWTFIFLFKDSFCRQEKQRRRNLDPMDLAQSRSFKKFLRPLSLLLVRSGHPDFSLGMRRGSRLMRLRVVDISSIEAEL